MIWAEPETVHPARWTAGSSAAEGKSKETLWSLHVLQACEELTPQEESGVRAEWHQVVALPRVTCPCFERRSVMGMTRERVLGRPCSRLGKPYLRDHRTLYQT